MSIMHFCQGKEDMSYDKYKKTLRYLMFSREKRDATIKACRCADGRLQREYTDKMHTSSYMVFLEAMTKSYAIDAKEGRYC